MKKRRKSLVGWTYDCFIKFYGSPRILGDRQKIEIYSRKYLLPRCDHPILDKCSPKKVCITIKEL